MHVNYITDKGARALADILKTNKVIQEIYLNESRISDEGCIAIAKAAINHPSLRTIHITNTFNYITDTSAEAFAELIRQNNRNLVDICLFGNDISEKGAIAITEALRYNHFIREINLAENDLDFNDQQFVLSILDALEENKSLFAGCIFTTDEFDTQFASYFNRNIQELIIDWDEQFEFMEDMFADRKLDSKWYQIIKKAQEQLILLAPYANDKQLKTSYKERKQQLHALVKERIEGHILEDEIELALPYYKIYPHPEVACILGEALYTNKTIEKFISKDLKLQSCVALIVHAIDYNFSYAFWLIMNILKDLEILYLIPIDVIKNALPQVIASFKSNNPMLSEKWQNHLNNFENLDGYKLSCMLSQEPLVRILKEKFPTDYPFATLKTLEHKINYRFALETLYPENLIEKCLNEDLFWSFTEFRLCKRELPIQKDSTDCYSSFFHLPPAKRAREESRQEQQLLENDSKKMRYN